jgi:hypothetical protein
MRKVGASSGLSTVAARQPGAQAIVRRDLVDRATRARAGARRLLLRNRKTSPLAPEPALDQERWLINRRRPHAAAAAGGLDVKPQAV